MSAPYILVVDDEPDICGLVKEILEDEDYEVGTAENGASARRALRERRPDLILLDIWMPDVDGITLLKEWAEGDEGLPCPVIMMSGHGTVETAVEATRLGAYDFLEKPLSLAKLLLTVQHAFEADRSEMASLGYEPTTRRWSHGRPFVGRVDGPDVPVTSDSGDAGYLTVTYKWRSMSERGEASGGGAPEDV